MNQLSCKIPLKRSLNHAEVLFMILKQYEQSKIGLPSVIAAMIFPDKDKDSKNTE